MQTVLLVYGGISTEHEVAIISALQAGNALKEAGYNVLPAYITKRGHWYLGDDSFLKPENYTDLNFVKKNGRPFVITPDRSIGIITKSTLGFKKLKQSIDVIFPVFHGRNGEDGSIQGLLNLLGLPYVGCGLIASAVAIDKYLTKKVAKSLGLNVVDDVLIDSLSWQTNKKELMSQIGRLGSPVFVKPNTLGSTIGISQAHTSQQIENAIDVALSFDNRTIVEKAIQDPIEINISLIGNNPYDFSITEQPVRRSQVLSFQDKYLNSSATKNINKAKPSGMASASRYMPAKVSQKVIKQIQHQSILFFSSIGGRGISRLDFMIDKKGTIYLNEINNMPGSLSFYLWEKSNLPFTQMVKKLVNLALDYSNQKEKLITTFDSNILSGFISNSSGPKTKK